MKRLLVLLVVLGFVGTAAAFRSGALPGPYGSPSDNNNAITPASVTTGAVVGTTGTFSGQVQSNSANVLTAVTNNWAPGQIIVSGATIGIAANTRLSQFKTGAASTMTNWDCVVSYAGGVAATGTATADITTTAGTAQCSVSIDCTTLGTGGTLYSQATCATPALAANTVYEFREKAICTNTGFGYITCNLRSTTP